VIIEAMSLDQHTSSTAQPADRPALRGLTSQEAARRLASEGPNEVPQPKFNFWKAFASGLWNLSAWILEGALLLEVILGKGIQAAFVAAMLLFAAFNGAFQKRKSNRVLDDISHELTPVVPVERDGKWTKIDSKQLVRGDLINLTRGDVLAADAVLKTGSIACDESSITGESAPVTKKPGDTALSGTTVVQGSGLALVSATGSHSRSGKTVNLINQSAAPGHLQVLLTRIIYYLCLLDSVLTAVLIIAALIRHENIISMLPFLAMMFIASIPVAMPSTFAVSNSFEAKALTGQGILTSDLTGIQDAANVDVLLSDKTGTITENQTAVSSWTNMSSYSQKNALFLAASAADQRNQSVVDTAVLTFAGQHDLHPAQPEDFTPFSPTTGYSHAHVTVPDTHDVVDVKLGSFKVLSRLDSAAEQKARQAGVDFAAGRSVAVLINNQLAGVFILSDIIRKDSASALADLQTRGITTIMLTGDNQKTAQAVATRVGLPGTVVSRNDIDLDTVDPAAPDAHIAGIADVLPEGKLEIVKALQKHGHIVAMTGDGVNDAPALKQAEVGIAVSNAADVAKRSGKMVLLKDGLTPILHILDAGHRVHRRMITWAISKLARTAELTMLITLVYLVFKRLPLGLNAMVIFTIMNNMVTMMLGTDNAVASRVPEKWDIASLSRLSFCLAGTWTIVGFGLFWILSANGWKFDVLTTIMFVFLELTAVMLMLAARTSGFFWRSIPSVQVWSVQLADIVITVVLALTGLAMEARIGILDLLLTIGVVLVFGVLIDLLYVPLARRSGIADHHAPVQSVSSPQTD
jgi:H+-transporting ATPase